MMQKADIITADISHIKQIAEIEISCIPGGWSEKLFLDTLDNPGTIMLAAVINEKVIGFLNGSYVIDEAELMNIAVSREHRRDGIAGALIESFENRLSEKGVNTVYLEVRESNFPAKKLYEKYGYIQIGLRKNYYRSPDENAVLMMKKLEHVLRL